MPQTHVLGAIKTCQLNCQPFPKEPPTACRGEGNGGIEDLVFHSPLAESGCEVSLERSGLPCVGRQSCGFKDV